MVQPIPMAGVDRLKQRYAVEAADHVLSKEEIITAVREMDALVCSTNNQIDAQVIQAGKRLKVISNLGAGFKSGGAWRVLDYR